MGGVVLACRVGCVVDRSPQARCASVFRLPRESAGALKRRSRPCSAMRENHPREVVAVELAVGERVIAVCVKPGRDQYQLGAKHAGCGQHGAAGDQRASVGIRPRGVRPPGRTARGVRPPGIHRKDHRPCHRPSSSTPSAPRSAAPSRARSPRCGRTRRSPSSSTSCSSATPGVDPASVEEVVAGCGLPQGLQANNIARIAVLLSDKLGQETNGIDRLALLRVGSRRDPRSPPTTSSPARATSTSRVAWSSSRATTQPQEAAHPEDQNEHAAGQGARRSPTRTSRWVSPPRTSPSSYGVTREQQDEYAQRSQERAVAAQQPTGSSTARSSR